MALSTQRRAPRLASAGIIVALLTMLAACGGAPASAPTSVPAPTSAPAASDSGGGDLRFERMKAKDGTELTYAVATPAGFNPASSYPVLLALPPGGQDKDVTEQVMERLWASEGIARGWVVISPVAPGGRLFFDGGERYIPELLDATAATYRPEGGRYFLAGISNGGLSAFRVILNTPERFRALLVLPGYPPSADDAARLSALKAIPVALFVGAEDSGWREESQRTYQALHELGATVTLEVVPNEGHIIRSLTGTRLFAVLEQMRAGG